MATDLKYELVWQRVDPALEEELIAFWLANRALPTREAAAARTHDVAMIARDGERLAAVASIAVTFVPQLQNSFFQFRMFVGPPYRRSRVGAELLKRLAAYFESEFAAGRTGNCIGILMIIEHPGIRAQVTYAVTPTGPDWPLELIFVGVDAKGNHYRVYYFKDALIAPPYRLST